MPPPSSSPTRTWQRFEATFTPSDTDTDATLTISFQGPGTLWIDQVSLMPTETVFGWRRDVAEALKALKPGIIRFGGSTMRVLTGPHHRRSGQARPVHDVLGRAGAGQRRPRGVP